MEHMSCVLKKSNELLLFLQGEVCGLCGNFDGNAKNDFTTQGQLVVSKPLEFANSWKLYSNFPDQTADLETCTSAPRENWAKTMCHIIKDTFNECHYMVICL